MICCNIIYLLFYENSYNESMEIITENNVYDWVFSMLSHANSYVFYKVANSYNLTHAI